MRAPIVRPARKDDLERLLAIHTAAFPDDRNGVARARNFEHTAFGRFEDLRVFEDDGRILAHAFCFPFEAWFGGRPVPTAGIASVGVAPEARGRGVGARLLAALEAEARARGDVLALLHPFRHAFYARHGYAPVTPLFRIETSPDAVPDAWVRAARAASLRSPSAELLPGIEAAYQRKVARSTGAFSRPPTLWQRKHLNERRHVIALVNGEEVRGYVAFSHSQAEPHADITLMVDEIAADDFECERILIGALGAQRDQVRTLSFVTSRDDALILALEDAARHTGGTEHVEHPLGTLMNGPMVKVLDVERALGARGFAGEGRTSFSIDGGSGGSFALDITANRALLTREGEPEIAITSRAFASIFFGAVRASEAARLGWIDGSREALRALDALAAMPAFEVVDPF